MSQPSPISVSQLNALVKSLLDTTRISFDKRSIQFNKNEPGHWYFSLKDKTAQISVFFKQYQDGIDLQQGDQIQVLAKVTLYEARVPTNASFTMSCPLASELNKQSLNGLRKLNEEGLFAQDKKRLPAMPEHIGLITSAQGAAVHDIIKIFKGCR